MAGIGATLLAAQVGRRSALQIANSDAEARRQERFLAERRQVYLRFLAALTEWEPLRDKAWEARQRPNEDADAREAEWTVARAESERAFRRLAEAQQEVDLIAPRAVREAATRLFVETARTAATARFLHEFITAVRIDLETDAVPQDAVSPLLLDPGAFGDVHPEGEGR